MQQSCDLIGVEGDHLLFLGLGRVHRLCDVANDELLYYRVCECLGDESVMVADCLC